ncbi:MAG: NAD(+) diphosphatase [Paludibacteraceae bacterium]|nr:NAD(+) diphosphatase [Paludibacteraceae bacterium]
MALVLNPKATNSKCYAVVGRDLILKHDGSLLSFDDLHYLKNSYGGGDFIEESEYNYCVLGLDSIENLSTDYSLYPIRSYFADWGEEETLRLSRAKAIRSWVQDNRFCCHCGHSLTFHQTFSAMECPQCKKLIFPRIEPCVIVLVRRGEEILLAKHTQRNHEVYACIAGFMEAGETAEQAVRREIAEETGIKVKNICYKGSQSWPFPAQLMLAFTAEYESGEIKIQEDELSDARWFNRNDNPATPPKGSIAYKLIHNEL